jgi:HK97 family phage portal protein
MRGIATLIRSATPKGTRDPEPAPWQSLGQPWWGPWNQLPWSSDGMTEPTVMNTAGDAVASTIAIPAAWRATNFIAGFIAQMSLTEMNGHPPTASKNRNQLLENPWPMIGYFNWMFGCVASVVLRGNFYAVKADYDPNTGMPRQYIPIAHDDVTCELEDGFLWYTINGFPRKLAWTEMFHARGFMLPGMLTGIGVVEAHRSQLTATRQLMDYGAGAYAGGGVPPVVLRVDKPELTEQEAEYLQKRWVQRHTALDRRPAVLPKIVELEKVGLSMQDAEYLQSRQFAVAEIAYMFNLDPADLSANFGSHSGRLEYQNMEAKTRDRMIYSLQRWMSPIEQAFGLDLTGDSRARFGAGELFRADVKSRMETYDIALRNNIYTLDEVREMEWLDPLPPSEIVDRTPPALQPFAAAPKVVATIDKPKLESETPALTKGANQ